MLLRAMPRYAYFSDDAQLYYMSCALSSRHMFAMPCLFATLSVDMPRHIPHTPFRQRDIAASAFSLPPLRLMFIYAPPLLRYALPMLFDADMAYATPRRCCCRDYARSARCCRALMITFVAMLCYAMSAALLVIASFDDAMPAVTNAVYADLPRRLPCCFYAVECCAPRIRCAGARRFIATRRAMMLPRHGECCYADV